jgi:hypothetical protein
MITTVRNDDEDNAPGLRPRNADSIPAPVRSPSMAPKHAACNDDDDDNDDDNDGNDDEDDDANHINNNGSGSGSLAAVAAAAGMAVGDGGSSKSGRQ